MKDRDVTKLCHGDPIKLKNIVSTFSYYGLVERNLGLGFIEGLGRVKIILN